MKCVLLDDNCKLFKKYKEDAGFDLSCRLDEPLTLHSMTRATIKTGVCVSIPVGSFGLITTRSSADQQGLHVSGVIDAGYTGEIKLNVSNMGINPVTILPYSRIAQLIVIDLNRAAQIFNVEYVKELEETDRGINGFGSTGGVLCK